MQSIIAEAIRLKSEPVAILWSDERPGEAIQFAPGRRGCLMTLFAQAAKGRTAVIDRETFGCFGGGTGAGFGDQFARSPGGMDRFQYFLSTGIITCDDPQRFDEILEKTTIPEQREHLLHGERYRKTPSLVRSFVSHLPILDIPATYVIFKPLRDLAGGERPVVVVFVGNPHQVSALVTLAHFRRDDNDSVIVPASAGCHQIMLYPYHEAASPHPRAVLGLTDPSARKAVAHILGDDVLTFAVPWQMFLEMEEDTPGSFLMAPTWQSIRERL
jgi:uncharacterized protein (DUF169 family)